VSYLLENQPSAGHSQAGAAFLVQSVHPLPALLYQGVIFPAVLSAGARNGNKQKQFFGCENPARTQLEAGFAAFGFYLCVLCGVLCDLCG